MKEQYKLYKGDCLEVMDQLIEQEIKVDMILCDPPYGTTACKWDSVIPFDEMWLRLNKLIKDNGAIVLFGSEPFSSKLRCSNLKNYKYDWVWNKKLAGNGILAKRQPLKIHENVIVFNSKIYIPQMTTGKLRRKLTNNPKISEINGGDGVKRANETFNDQYYPTSIQEFSIANLRRGRLHPTQKPVELLEYLIKTYTNEGDLILDNCAGSGTTAIAAIKEKRHYIGMELNKEYYDIACKRIKKEQIEIKSSLFNNEYE